MKTYLYALVILGSFALSACSSSSSGGGGGVLPFGGTGGTGHPDGTPVDLANFNIPGFSGSTEISQTEYYDATSKQRPATVCDNQGSFRLYVPGEVFSKVATIRNSGASALSGQTEETDTVQSVTDTHLEMNTNYDSIQVEGFSGQALESNSAPTICNIQNGKKNCNTEFKITPEFQRFLDSKGPGNEEEKKCTFESKDGLTQTSYLKGTYTLKNGRKVNAVVMKFQQPGVQKCAQDPEVKQTTTYVSVSTDGVKGSPNECGPYGSEVYLYFIRQDANLKVITELENRITLAPAL